SATAARSSSPGICGIVSPTFSRRRGATLGPPMAGVPSETSHSLGARERSPEFEALLDTIAGLAAANLVVIETLHEHRVLDRRHFAYAFGRVLDRLAPELRGGMVERTLRDMRDRCMNVRGEALSDLQAWLGRLQREKNRDEDAA